MIQKYRFRYWSLREVKSFIVLQCAAFEQVTQSALEFLLTFKIFIMIFYNKKFPVAVCILKVFVCIHKGCTLVFKLNDMGFPPHG